MVPQETIIGILKLTEVHTIFHSPGDDYCAALLNTFTFL